MKWLTRILGVVLALCLFFILLINAADYAIYYRPQFYEKTFAKYGVEEYAQMEMSEILKVSDYLIDYLKGKHSTLKDFRAVVDGQERPFYSQREMLHMADVKVLFQIGIWMRRVCILVGIMALVLFLLIGKRYLQSFLRCILGTFVGIAVVLGVLVGIISADFNRAFIRFHKLFFDNDLWLLDPDKDWVIRLLPEGFFMDMAAVIGITFATSLVVVIGACVCGLIFIRKHNKQIS